MKKYAELFYRLAYFFYIEKLKIIRNIKGKNKICLTDEKRKIVRNINTTVLKI